MNRPWLLDLFCGAGGAGEGYRRAGFHVVSCDLVKQPRNPHEFYQGDALTVLDTLLAGDEWQGYVLHDFQAIHASPPCQDASALHALYPEKVYPKLIIPTRERLLKTRIPWVIENVMPAKLHSGMTLCGAMFGLRTYRHRRFESSHLLYAPQHPRHVIRSGSGKGQTQRKAFYLAGGFVTVTGNVGTYCGIGAMGIDWMIGKELSQAIPPAYTEWIGRQLVRALENAA